MNRRAVILSILGLGAATFGGAAWYVTRPAPFAKIEAQTEPPMPAKQPEALMRSYSPSFGPEDAPVTIVEFFDPACEACRSFDPIVKDIMAECDKLLTRNKIFIDRVKDVGTFSKEDAISFGFTGPMLRACGVPYDVRRADPYSVYDEIDFEIPIGSTGDCFDRYLVRMEEIRQSISIIEQAADMMPAGPIMTDERLMHYPDKKEVYGNIEGLIDHFKLVMEGHQPPEGEVYLPTEGGNGEIGFYLVSDGSGDPVRVRMRPACFNYVEAMPAMTVGHYVADIVPIFGSVNMIGGELDR